MFRSNTSSKEPRTGSFSSFGSLLSRIRPGKDAREQSKSKRYSSSALSQSTLPRDEAQQLTSSPRFVATPKPPQALATANRASSAARIAVIPANQGSGEQNYVTSARPSTIDYSTSGTSTPILAAKTTGHPVSEMAPLTNLKDSDGMRPERARAAQSQMDQAFAVALRTKQDPHVREASKFTAVRQTKRKIMSFEALVKVEAQLATSKATRNSTLDISKATDVGIDTRQIYRQTVKYRSNSLQGLVPEQKEAVARDIYSRKPLPPLPSSIVNIKNHWTSTPRDGRKRARISRNSLQQPVSVARARAPTVFGRRNSCPPPLEPHDRKVETTSSERSKKVDHVFGVLIFFSWLAGGRRFFHPLASELLRRPGSRCLTIELPVLNFEAEFTKATISVWKGVQEVLPGLPKYANMPYESNSFDVVSSQAIATTVKAADLAVTLEEIHRVLKPGGVVQLTIYGSVWVNAGPKATEQQKKFCAGLLSKGFNTDALSTMPTLLEDAGFTSIEIAHLAIPLNKTSRVSAVFAKYLEPLRSLREAQICTFPPGETSQMRWAEIEEEVASYRSCRTVGIIHMRKPLSGNSI